jgi:ArsR family transcriptional regulator
LVELLAPLFDRVIAVDRSEKQLEAAERRLSSHGYQHVELVQAAYDDTAIVARVAELGGADAVFAVRLLHHAPRPQRLVSLLGSLVRPGGQVVVIDYCSHLINPEVFVIPAARYGSGPDAHLKWQVLAARRGPKEETRPS